MSSKIKIIDLRDKEIIKESDIIHSYKVKNNFCKEILFPRILFGPMFLLFGSVGLLTNGFKPELNGGVVISSLFLLFGVITSFSVILEIFQKPEYIFTKEYLYRKTTNRLRKFTISSLIKDISLENNVIRIRSLTYSGGVFIDRIYIPSLENPNKTMLEILDLLSEDSNIKDSNFESYVNNSKKLFSTRSERSYFLMPYIMMSFIGLFWILGSSLFLYGGTTELIENNFQIDSILLVLICIPLIFFLGGLYIFIEFGLKGIFFSDREIIGIEEGVVLKRNENYRILAWDEIKGVSRIKQKGNMYEGYLKGPLEYQPRRSYRPESIYILAKDELKPIFEIIKEKISK